MDGLPLITSDYMIDRVCEDKTAAVIPEPLRVQLVLSRFTARVGTVMAGSAKYPRNVQPSGENLALLALLEQEFMDLTVKFSEKLTSEHNNH